MTELHTAKEILDYVDIEFSETLLHAELCRACARADKRSIRQSLRRFATRRLTSVQRPGIIDLLQRMRCSMFPESEVARLRAAIGKIESAIVRSEGVHRR